MATIKSYTDIEQSRKLIELEIDTKTADMYYSWVGTAYILHAESYNELIAWRKYYAKTHKHPSCRTSVIPCWSLAALLGVLPNYEINNFGNGIQLAVKNVSLVTEGDETLLDLIVDMIIHLHELKML